MRRVLASMLCLLCAVLYASPSRAVSPAAVDDLTKQIRALAAQHRQGDASALSAMVNAAAIREQRLLQLIVDRPAAVLRLAIPADERAALPAAVRPYVEEAYAGEGELQILHQDFPSGAGRYVYVLRSAERLDLYFAADPPRLRTGDRVRVSGGVRVGQSVALASGLAQVNVVVGGGGGDTTGVKRTLAILVNLQDKPSPIAAGQAQTILFGSGASVSSYFYEASYKRASLSGDVVGPYTIAMKSTACDPDTLGALAQAAAAAHGTSVSGYDRLIYASPGNSCGWMGMGTVGGSPGEVWLNNGFTTRMLSHEMGHNYGLYHSHAFDCGSVAIKQNCASVEYGDLFDTMGNPYTAMHYNAAQKERLGWLDASGAPPIATVSGSGVYTLAPYETPGTDPKALKVQTPSGDWYYVEYRQPIGFDASGVAGSPSVKNGVLVHFWDQPSNPDKIYILDMTPAKGNWNDPGLAVNAVFSDAAGISITPVWVNGTGAGVNVTVPGGAPGCVRNAPTVRVSPAQQQADAGTMLTYAVTIKNNDVGCSVATFSQTAAAPSGWTVTFDAPTITIPPGGTASTAMDVTSADSTATGTYGVMALSTNNASPNLSNGTSASYLVVAGGNPGTFSDGFDRADASTLGDGWTQVSGSLAVQSGGAVSGASRALHMAVVTGLSGPSQDASATFTAVDTRRFPRWGLVLRYQDPKNYYACYRISGGNNQLRIVKVVRGSEKVLKSLSVQKPTVNQSFALSCQVQGTSLTLALDGVTQVTASDSALATGSVGLFMGYASGTGPRSSQRVDDFSASVE